MVAPLIVKAGGGEAINLAGVARDVAALTAQGTPLIIVHGANAARDALAQSLGKEVRVLTSASGVSSVQSDDEAIDLLMLAYSGLRNKRLVEQLQLAGCNAIGLSGLDGRVITGKRNAGIRVRQGERTLLVRDHSGKPVAVNVSLLELLLSHRYTPVLTMPIADENGAAINSENDDVVAVLADAMRSPRVIELIEAPGLLEREGDDASLFRTVTIAQLTEWEARAAGRFRRKLKALIRIAGGGRTVIVADGRSESPVSDALHGAGTVVAA